MARTTDSFFALVEATFNVDEITPEKIMDKFYSGTFGDIKGGWYKSGKKRTQKSQATLSGQSVFRGLSERLAEGREIYEEIDEESKKEFPDFDELRNLRNRAKGLDIHSKVVVDKAQEEMDVISEKLKVKRIEKEKVDERKISIEKDLDDIEDLGDVDNVKRRIKRLAKKDVDVSDLDSRLEEIRFGLEAQREEEREERIKIQQEQQEEARERKERLREESIEPEF